MDNMIIIAIAVLLIYTLTLCCINGKIPNSLSQSVFMLPPSASWLWTLVIGFVAVAVMPKMLDVAGDNWKFMAFLSCIGLIFVALCPLSPRKNGIEYKVHMTGAWMSAVCSQLLVAVTKFWQMSLWIPWIAAFVFLTCWYGWRTKVLWAEMTCFATIFILLLS